MNNTGLIDGNSSLPTAAPSAAGSRVKVLNGSGGDFLSFVDELVSDELVCSIDLIQHHWSSWLRQGDLLAIVIPILFMYKKLFFRKSWMHMLNCWQSWLPFKGTLSVTISCRSWPVSIFHILMLLLRIKISSSFTSSELASLPAKAKSLPCRAKHLSRLKSH